MDLVWKRHLKYMLEYEVNCDVTFKVGEDQETIKAHKFILSMRSPVFQDMIESKKDLLIPDIGPEVFRELLRFCYNQDSVIKEDIALSLVYAARKYQLPLQEHLANRSHDSLLPHLIYQIKHPRIDSEWYPRLKHVLEKEIDCDVNFKVGEDQEAIKAHKFILSMRSLVFEIMFNGSFCESEMDPIIPDLCPAAFRALLRYCYYECLVIQSEIGLSVLYAAKKYMLPRLEDAARESVIKNLDKSEMLEIAKYAADTGDDALHEGCRNYIVLHLDELNVWDIHKQAADIGDDVLQEISRDYLVRNLDALNVWGMFEYASSTGDDKLYAACRNYIVVTLNSSNIWEVCKYATVTGDEELHTSCKKYLNANLNISNIFEVYKYAIDTGDEVLHVHCRSHLMEGLKMSKKTASFVLLVTQLAFSVEDDKLLSCLKAYLKGHPTNIWEIYKYSINNRHQEAQSLCRQYFEGDVRAVREALQTEAFLNIPYEVLLDFLHINDKAVHVDEYTELKQGTQTDIVDYQNRIGISISKIEHFKACYAWAEAECQRQKIESTGANKRKVLGECLHLIRFTIPLQEINLEIIKPAFTVEDNDFRFCCQAYLKGHQDNVWVIYEYAVNAGDQEAQSLCRQYFEGDVRTVSEALQTEAFLNIPYEVLLDFLHINDKAVHMDEYTGLKQGTQTDASDYQNCIGISISEIELFKACNAWAEAECFGQMIKPTGANKRTVLSECLHLIRFPTMLQKDLLSAVYPTDILTQSEVSHLQYTLSGFTVKGRPEDALPKQSDKKQVQKKQQGSPRQPVFPSRQRQFLVIPSGTNAQGAIGTVFIESKVRVMLSRIWTSHPGRYRVTVRDEQLEWSWSVVLSTKHQNHLSADNAYLLPHLDIKPHVLMGAGIKYSVTAERIECSNLLYRQLNEKCTRIRFDELRIGCTEITVTQNPSTKCNIYALTLCLV